MYDLSLGKSKTNISTGPVQSGDFEPATIATATRKEASVMFNALAPTIRFPCPQRLHKCLLRVCLK